MTKFIKLQRSGVNSYYIHKADEILEAIRRELADLKNRKQGDTITLTVVEMSDDEYQRFTNLRQSGKG
jgi:hypothetical protein